MEDLNSKTPEKVNIPLKKTSDKGSEVLSTVATEAIEKVSELVPTQSQGSAQDDTVVQSRSGFLDMSQRILGLVGKSSRPQHKTVKIPKPEVQRIEITKALGEKVNLLQKKLRKIGNQTKTAYKAQIIIKKIRELQRMIAEIADMALDKLEDWYRTYVLRERKQA